MSDDLIDMVKECLTEHSKTMVSQSQCQGKLWGVIKWAFPLSLSVAGCIAGLLITLKVDLSTISTEVKNNDRRITTIEASYPSIDRKLDMLLGDVKPTRQYIDSMQTRYNRSVAKR